MSGFRLLDGPPPIERLAVDPPFGLRVFAQAALPDTLIYADGRTLLAAAGRSVTLCGGGTPAWGSLCRLLGADGALRRCAPGRAEGLILRREAAPATGAPPAPGDLCRAYAILSSQPDFSVAFDRFYWMRSLQRRRGAAEVYEAGGATVTVVRAPFGCLLTAVATAPEQQGRGAATRLLQGVLGGCAGPVWLFCRPAVRGFYERLGFAEAGYWRQRLDAPRGERGEAAALP